MGALALTSRMSDFLAQHRFLCARQQVLAEE
ncbi:hypothetical protein HaLaN_21074, partial [Haematococcus lacustris]